MNVREDDGGKGNHTVQFFDSDESRAHAVAAYLAAGYADGRSLIVIARPRNWTAIRERLEASGVPVQGAIVKGRVVSENAVEMLRRITRHGSPDPAAFDAAIGAVVKQVAAHGPVCAYGEMVDMLAQAGDVADAIKLEALWNGLAACVPFSLMCGYSAAHFVATSSHRALREICAAHGEVHRHAQDALASWLLDAAHDRSETAAPLEL